LLAEGDDATQSPWQRGVPLFPSEQTQPNLRKHKLGNEENGAAFVRSPALN
jgi:hypothetical protein